jgi:hypothetical protein
VNNWNYTEYIPVVPHYLLDCLIDWCLTPTLAVFQLYRCRMSAKYQKHLRSQLKHIGQHGVNVLWKLAKYAKLPTIVVPISVAQTHVGCSSPHCIYTKILLVDQWVAYWKTSYAYLVSSLRQTSKQPTWYSTFRTSLIIASQVATIRHLFTTWTIIDVSIVKGLYLLHDWILT